MEDKLLDRHSADAVNAAHVAIKRMMVTGEAANVPGHYHGDILRCELTLLRAFLDLYAAYAAFDVQVKLDRSGRVETLLRDLDIERDTRPAPSCGDQPTT